MGWKPLGFSEIEKFPSQVLAHHYPTVTNFGDMTKYKEWNLNDSIGLLVGGTPCQSFSVAGLRKGLDDPRGNLALTYVGILDKFRPKWCIWENVPGVLSSGGGRDFGSFLGALDELGYGWAYRVLDAQNFGVAQRRRRVFVVGCLGDWKPAAKVLFESESLSGNTKQSRTQREVVTGYVESSFGQYREDVIAGTAKASGGVMGGGSETFVVGALDRECGGQKLSHQSINSGHIFATYEWHNQDSRIKPVEIAATLNCNAGGREGHLVQNITSIQGNLIGRDKGGPQGIGVSESETMYTLTKADVHGVAFGWQNSSHQGMSVDTISPTLDKSKTPATMQNMAVRRLTPVECERLQGFPDNYTNIPKAADGNRYKALGNSMAVPVMRWIGERINQYEQRGMEKHL
jgi:DNA (cytosine-5)-methyltransferase 1